jgi:hypothetical protein
MKLYTENQLRYIYNCYDFNLDQNGCSIMDENKHFEQCIKTLTPIELPSNEQIEELSKNTNFEYDYFNYGFLRGAEWIKEQILKQKQ